MLFLSVLACVFTTVQNYAFLPTYAAASRRKNTPLVKRDEGYYCCAGAVFGLQTKRTQILIEENAVGSGVIKGTMIANIHKSCIAATQSAEIVFRHQDIRPFFAHSVGRL